MSDQPADFAGSLGVNLHLLDLAAFDPASQRDQEDDQNEDAKPTPHRRSHRPLLRSAVI
jgi:hypothetical protein